MSDDALSLPPDDEGAAARFEGMSDQELLEHLAGLDRLQYEQARKTAAKKLRISRVRELDAIVEDRRAALQEQYEAVSANIDALAASANEIIECYDVLGLFDADWSRLIAGERRNGRLLLLAGTSRLLSKPMHVAIKGSSSGGKSEVRKTALNFFPPESVISFTTLSEKALLYEERDFEHKILSMGEAAGADEQGMQDYLLRELMSEQHLRYPTVQRIGNELTTVTIEKSGPVSFMVTTTKLLLHPENETRMLSIDIDDSEDQTRAVLRKIAESESALSSVSFKPWQDYQRWLEMGERKVSIPYARVLADNVPPKSVRLRRDFGQVLTAIKSHALLHRNHRERDINGYIVANVEHDYAVIRELMHDLLCQGSEAGVKEAVRETASVVEELTKGLDVEQGVTAVAVAKKLKLDKSAARRRLVDACIAELVINLEKRKGHPGKYRRTDESVEAEDMMPTVEALAALLGPDTPLPPLPPCHPIGKSASEQRLSGGTDGGNGICHRDDLQVVANRSATAIATAETLRELPKTEERWFGGNGGKGGQPARVADPDDPSSYLDDESARPPSASTPASDSTH